MAWLFPGQPHGAQTRRLDALMASHRASTEALSRTAHEAKASAEESESLANAITDAARGRLKIQEERRRRRQAQIAMLQGALGRDR